MTSWPGPTDGGPAGRALAQVFKLREQAQRRCWLLWFPEFFNEVLEIPGMQLGARSLRRNQFAPMSKTGSRTRAHTRTATRFPHSNDSPASVNVRVVRSAPRSPADGAWAESPARLAVDARPAGWAATQPRPIDGGSNRRTCPPAGPALPSGPARDRGMAKRRVRA
jgi:hypothetical protein